MEKYCKVVVGTKVDIQRTDGRVHSALVSCVNLETKSVTVEWFENGETKGKEIDIEQVLALNPALNVQLKTPPKSVPVANKRITNTPNNVKNVKVETTAAPTPRVTRGRSERPTNLNLNEAENGPVSDGPQRKDSTNSNPSNRRRSNCVKEVERLKKNREERRAQQQEQKEMQLKLQQEYDPGNPNWQFLQMIREYQEALNFKAMTMNEPIGDHQICVCVRKRPLSKKELNKKEIDMCTIPETDLCVVHECKLKVDLTKYLENHKFWFDYAFDEYSTNEMVYRYTARPLVETIFNQGMATCFAYGQTGSGKTHTMGGTFTGKQQDSSNGIYAMAAQDVFKLLKHPKHKNKDLVISCSYFEIYGSKVFDLLNKRKKLRVLEDGNQQVQVCQLEEKIVHSVQDVLKLIDLGNKLRTSGQTSANQNSSRSHAVFQIVLRKRGYRKEGGGGHLYGKFSLIDLAGNERGADTSTSDRHTRLEGAEINKSLLALKYPNKVLGYSHTCATLCAVPVSTAQNCARSDEDRLEDDSDKDEYQSLYEEATVIEKECIRALGRKGAHLPFRASKLTQVLRDSFIGENSKTCMIAMVSPGMSCCEHTLNTLRYADRVKELGPENKKRKPAASEGGDLDDDDISALSPMGDKIVNNQDLAMLCTHSGTGDHSQELYTFHEAVSQLNDIEDKIVDDHKSSIEEAKTLLAEEEKLVERIDSDVDYDVEDYVKRLDEILAQKIKKFSELREKVGMFRKQLEEEEMASRNIRKLPGY